ncbi:O-antigen ligase family protein [Anaerococcus sp.]|uniref:O-antigen ligase family protein n=1 Tax=Anaerococcus sp. TaxID=1872515 RepID=UPI00258D801D|nr:O-antigen ligase family protein [Anaerococcus sp.]MDU3212204.1 O-antigen ligase family protein [Anaerococcus sp.]
MTNTKINQNKISKILIVLACILSNLSQLPYFVNNGKTQIISIPIWFLSFIILLSINRFKISRHLFKLLLLTIIFIILILTFSIIYNKNYFSSSMIYSLAISLFIIIIGSLISPFFNRDTFQEIVISYVLSSLIVSIVVFIKYFGFGFSLNTRIYAYSSKNSLSQILFTSVIIFYCYFKPKNNFQNIIKILIIIFQIFMLVILRSRATILGLVIVSFFIIFSKSMNKKKKIIVIIGGILLLILLFISDNFNDIVLNNIIFAGRDINDLDNLSSGRISIIREFPILIKNNWLTGIGPFYFECFPLSAILQFGLFAGGILIYISLLPLITSIKRKSNDLWEILYFLSIGYFINSLFEGLAPFGPGIKCYFLWLLFGILFS